MPWRSLDQARWGHASGKLSPAKVREYDRATDFSRLPRRARRKKKSRYGVREELNR